MKTTELLDVNNINDIIDQIDDGILELVDAEGALLENHEQAMTLTKMLGDLTKAMDGLIIGDVSLLNATMRKYNIKKNKSQHKIHYMLVNGEFTFNHLEEVISQLYQNIHAQV